MLTAPKLEHGCSQGTQEPKQLGLFFFSESDASSLVSKILEQDPKLGRQARVLPVGMDQARLPITQG